MNRREHNKQKKKKERQERLRQEKHLRQWLPRGKANAEVGKDVDLNDPEERSRPIPAVPAPFQPGGRQLESNIDSAGTEGTERLAPRPDGPLDNFFVGEPAQKWLNDLLADTDTNPIVRTLDPVSIILPDGYFLKASVCCEMLVAAELVAAGVGRPSRHLPLRVAAWLLERDVLFSPGVVALAAAAVRQVGEFSELRHLWDTVRLSQEWLRGVEALHSRLQR